MKKNFRTLFNRVQKDPSKSVENPVKCTVLMDDVYSMEYYKCDETYTQVLRGVSFSAYAGQSWAVVGNSVFEMRLFLEIIANAKPYQKGRCVLSERGMLRKKRLALPHVYYIGSTNMLINNLTVLEYLMFVTDKVPGSSVVRKRKILEQLIECGLGFVSLMMVHDLTPEERSLVTLFTALYMPSQIIVWNLPRLSYDERLIHAARTVAEEMRKQGRSLIFSARDYVLAQAVSSHVLYLKDGKIDFSGETEPFIEEWDRSILDISDEAVDKIKVVFEQAAPQYECRVGEDGSLQVWTRPQDSRNLAPVFSILAENGIAPDTVTRNRGRLDRALSEATGGVL